MKTPLMRVACLFCFMIPFLFASCIRKKEIKVGVFESYQDPIYGFGISFPTEWAKDPETGKRIRVYSSLDARDRFLDPLGSKPAGVSIEVGIDMSAGVTLESYVDEMKKHLAETSILGEEEKMSLAGNDAIKIPYSMRVDSRNVIHGYKVAALKENLITYVEVMGFNELLDDYKVIFDTSLTTVRFGRSRAAKKKEDISKPSEIFETYRGKFFDIDYPANFDFKFPQKPNTDLVMELKGYRQDCVMRLELSDAKNLTVEKVLEQNKSNLEKAGYRIKNTGTTTISGNRAQFVNLSYLRGEVDSRAYFMVQGNRLYYIFLTWYRPQSNVYMPIFAKMVKSLKTKS